MLPTLLPWIEAEYGARVTLQQNGLSAFTGEGVGSYWADLKAAGQWTTVGWQMFGSGLANGSLETAFGSASLPGGRTSRSTSPTSSTPGRRLPWNRSPRRPRLDM